MRGFRLWLREDGFVIEGAEWENGAVLARRLDFEKHAYWEFDNMNKARDYFLAAFGPDAHVIFSSAGELRFEVPGLLPVKPSAKGDDEVVPPVLAQPESPDVAKPVRERKTKAPLRAIK